MRIWPRRPVRAKRGTFETCPVSGRVTVIPVSMKITESTDHDYIRDTLLLQVQRHMDLGAEHYGPNNHTELGIKGQFADMYRKFRPLKARMWDGKPDVNGKESTREICMDLIGHCLLTIAMIDRASYAGGPPIVVTAPSKDDSTDRLRAAGWTEIRPGHFEPPSEVKRGPEFRPVTVIVSADGTRHCSNCKARIHGHTCNCDPA